MSYNLREQPGYKWRGLGRRQAPAAVNNCILRDVCFDSYGIEWTCAGSASRLLGWSASARAGWRCELTFTAIKGAGGVMRQTLRWSSEQCSDEHAVKN